MKSINNNNTAANTAAALNIKINRAKRTIEISKTFEKAASRYGSDEYIALTAAQQDNPGFSVKIISAKSKNTNPYAGLDYDFMKKYIEKHDDDKHSNMTEFLEMRAQDELSIELGAKSASFHEILDWFLEVYPEVKKYHEDREAKLEARRQKMAANKEKRQAAKQKAA